MSWEIAHYANRFAAGDLAPEDALEASVERGVFRVLCPSCGMWRQPFVMVDTRNWPGEFTGGAKFLCDGCWTRFEREGRASGEPGKTRSFTQAVMLEWAGAPAEILIRMEKSLAARRNSFADSEGAIVAAREGRMHASRIGIDIGAPAPGAEIAARIAPRAGRGG